MANAAREKNESSSRRLQNHSVSQEQFLGVLSRFVFTIEGDRDVACNDENPPAWLQPTN
jgi:hypothetical protein